MNTLIRYSKWIHTAAAILILALGSVVASNYYRAHHPPVINLGTVVVTPANVEPVYTADNAIPKTINLGTVTVTPADVEGARYAANDVIDLGTIVVTPANAGPLDDGHPVRDRTVGGVLAAAALITFQVAHALVFARFGS